MADEHNFFLVYFLKDKKKQDELLFEVEKEGALVGGERPLPAPPHHSRLVLLQLVYCDTLCAVLNQDSTRSVWILTVSTRLGASLWYPNDKPVIYLNAEHGRRAGPEAQLEGPPS